MRALQPWAVASVQSTSPLVAPNAYWTVATTLEAAEPGHAVRIERAPWLDFDTATALADPALDLATPLKGPFRSRAPGQ